MSLIHPRARLGTAFSCGENCVIEDDVRIGAEVHMGYGVVLRKGTRIGNFVDVGDYVTTTGLCIIGHEVSINVGCHIGKGVIINDRCYIEPHVVIHDGVNLGYGIEVESGVQVRENIVRVNPPVGYLPLAFDVFDRKRFLEGQVENGETLSNRSGAGQVAPEMV